MESMLLYILVGLSVFTVKQMTRKKPAIQPAAFPAAGALISALLSLAIGPSLDAMTRLPWPGMALPGAFGGFLLWLCVKFRWMDKPRIQYYLTTIVGFATALLGYGIMRLYNAIAGFHLRPDEIRFILPLSYLLIGFLTAFGFTFPQRWFQIRDLAEGGKTDGSVR